MRVCVIGAGVVGVTSAYFLARQGHDVVLVDSQPRPAEVSSYANGGSSATATSRRWRAGVLPSVPGWLLRSDSPLRFRPRLDPHQWRWCLQFALACRASVARASTAELLTLSYLSRDAMHALLARRTWFRPSEERQAHRLPQRRVAGQGARAGRLPGRAWRRPAGAGRRPDPGAGTGPGRHGRQPGGRDLHAQREAGDCRQFTEALFDRLQGMANVQCAMSNPVSGLQREGRVVAVQSRDGDIGADAVVLATGIGTRALLSPLGHDVPLYPLKGYSLTVPLADDDRMAPAISVTDYERRIVYARVGGVLRIAAMVDIGGGDAQIDPERIALLKRQVLRLPRPGPAPGLPWAGLRPATPEQAADRPQPGRQPVAEHRPGRAGLHAGLRQRGVAERADGWAGVAAGSGAVPALSLAALKGSPHGNVLCDSDCLFIGRRADPASIGWRFRCAGPARRSGRLDSHSSGEPHHVLSVPLFAILFWAGNVIVSKMAASAISHRHHLLPAGPGPGHHGPVHRRAGLAQPQDHPAPLAQAGAVRRAVLALFQALSTAPPKPPPPPTWRS